MPASKYGDIPGFIDYHEFAQVYSLHINTVRAHMQRKKCAWPRVTKTGKTRHPLYNTWENMIQRCYNPNHPQYYYWGGRGITVCVEWRHSFENFYAHIGDKPTADHSLDRINNNEGYKPGNVRWATKKQQIENRREYGRNS